MACQHASIIGKPAGKRKSLLAAVGKASEQVFAGFPGSRKGVSGLGGKRAFHSRVVTLIMPRDSGGGVASMISDRAASREPY